MRNKQQGMTAIGFVIIAIIVALIGFAGLKLTPVYLEHMKIVSTLNDVKDTLDGQNPSIQEIRSSINKRLVIEMVSQVKGAISRSRRPRQATTCASSTRTAHRMSLTCTWSRCSTTRSRFAVDECPGLVHGPAPLHVQG